MGLLLVFIYCVTLDKSQIPRSFSFFVCEVRKLEGIDIFSLALEMWFLFFYFPVWIHVNSVCLEGCDIALNSYMLVK